MAVAMRPSRTGCLLLIVLGASACNNGDTGNVAGHAGADLTPAQRAYCETSCGCDEALDEQGLDDCEAACADTLGENLDDSEAGGCGDEYAGYLVCLGNDFACDDVVVDVCKPELGAANDACNR